MRVAVVVREFADYVKGFVIREGNEIDAILSGDNTSHVVLTDHPAEDMPAMSDK